MLTDIDRQNLIEFGKQWKEAADNNKELFEKEGFNKFIEDDLRQKFGIYFESILKFVAKEDDGEIDQTEKNLIEWGQEFILNVKSESFDEAVDLIKQGFNQR
ncbi:MAG: hypothetical protein F6J93_27035 [Oscillatoria sp. SIO1A7]|nr:hypothetical protein [Oscillatoria sp. SIO1A7]